MSPTLTPSVDNHYEGGDVSRIESTDEKEKEGGFVEGFDADIAPTDSGCCGSSSTSDSSCCGEPTVVREPTVAADRSSCCGEPVAAAGESVKQSGCCG